jgi:hypothetical protein
LAGEKTPSQTKEHANSQARQPVHGLASNIKRPTADRLPQIQSQSEILSQGYSIIQKKIASAKCEGKRQRDEAPRVSVGRTEGKRARLSPIRKEKVL